MDYFKKKFIFIMVCLVSNLAFCGCVIRTLTVDSEPPGAMVYLDDEPIGLTPVTTRFTYYGTRKIAVEKTDVEGRLLYERKTVFEKIDPPYYQYFPLDFFSELILPVKLEDEHYFSYQLESLRQKPKEGRKKEVLKNAEELKERLYLYTPVK